MKTLVVYYTRTGNTRKVGEMIAEKLACDSEEIVDTKDRQGPMGYITGGRDAMKKNLTEIKPMDKDPSKYGLVIIGTPVWAWTMTPAVRTFLSSNKDRLKKVAFFCTMGGKPSKTFEDMEETSGKKAVATLALLDKDVKNTDITQQIEDFVRGLTRI